MMKQVIVKNTSSMRCSFNLWFLYPLYMPIWAIGTAIAGWHSCFTCLTGEADDSVDYEIDKVC